MWLAVVYLTLSAVLTLHTVFQFWLYLAARRSRTPVAPAAPEPWPFVTVQLPLYNERYVAARLLDAVAALDYPRDRLEIQVLDDSTDDTTSLVAQKCRELSAAGYAIAHVRRTERTGFKAGALQHGLASARGELVLLLDADFMPRADFLRCTVPHFADPRVAVVQGRWGHANRDATLLTRIQAFMIDVHFEIEQVGRSALGCFVNFNGSAGLWRVSAIHDAGGWSADTLTEDVDLSYRAQLRGWRIVFLVDVDAPAELPADMRAFRAQQYRWMKGVAQNARRLAPSILRAGIPTRAKAHAIAHLFESSNFVAMFGVLLLTPIAAHVVTQGTLNVWVVLNPLYLVNAVFLAPVYLAPRRSRVRGAAGVVGFVVLWVGFLAISLGLALHHTIAVIAGLFGHRSEFVRTPKAGDGPPIARGPYRVRTDSVFALELVFFAYLAVSLGLAIYTGSVYLLWIPALAFVGQCAIIGGYLRPWLRRMVHADARTTCADPSLVICAGGFAAVERDTGVSGASSARTSTH